MDTGHDGGRVSQEAITMSFIVLMSVMLVWYQNKDK